MRAQSLLVVLTALLLAACGSAAPGAPLSTAPSAAPPPAVPNTGPPTAETPAAAATSASAAPTPAAPSPVPAGPAAAAPQAMSTAPIRAQLAGGPGGGVTTVTSAAGSRLHVVVTGLSPGSTHAVHDHLGSCATASISRHLAVLAVAVADAGGTIVFDVTVPVSESGPGRIVIVYLGSRPNLIVGCADL